jgi:MFS family permease
VLQLGAIVFFGLTIPPSAVIADRYGRRAAMIGVTVAIALFGLLWGRCSAPAAWMLVACSWCWACA